MSETTTETTESDATSDVQESLDTEPEENTEVGKSEESDTFPREVVEELRRENGKYRQKAQHADALAERLHTELVRATGRLADPTDLPFDAEHLDDSDKLTAALDDLLNRKPHLATRKPSGDIGQGQRGGAAEPFSLLGLLKERT